MQTTYKDQIKAVSDARAKRQQSCTQRNVNYEHDAIYNALNDAANSILALQLKEQPTAVQLDDLRREIELILKQSAASGDTFAVSLQIMKLLRKRALIAEKTTAG